MQIYMHSSLKKSIYPLQISSIFASISYINVSDHQADVSTKLSKFKHQFLNEEFIY